MSNEIKVDEHFSAFKKDLRKNQAGFHIKIMVIDYKCTSLKFR